MKTLIAWSAKELSGKPPPVEALLDIVSPKEASRAGNGRFEDTLKGMIRAESDEKGSSKELPDLRRKTQAGDSATILPRSPLAASAGEPVGSTVRAESKGDWNVSAGASNQSSGTGAPLADNSIEFPASQPDGVKGAFAVQTDLTAFGLVKEMPGEEAAILPVATDAGQPGKPIDAGFSQVVPKMGQPGLDGIPLIISSLTQQKAGQPEFDGMHSIVSPPAQQVSELFPDAFVSRLGLPMSTDGEAFLGGTMWNMQYPDNPLDSASMVQPQAAIGNGLLTGFIDQTVQAGVVHTVGLEFENLFDGFVQAVRLAQRAGEAEIRVHLKPDFLGKLSIRVLADESGMRVQIKAENEIVRQIMQDNLADLQQRLAEKGFASDQLSVLADTGWTHRRDREDAQSGWPSHASEKAPEDAAEVAVEPVSPAQDGVINYLV